MTTAPGYVKFVQPEPPATHTIWGPKGLATAQSMAAWMVPNGIEEPLAFALFPVGVTRTQLQSSSIGPSQSLSMPSHTESSAAAAPGTHVPTVPAEQEF